MKSESAISMIEARQSGQRLDSFSSWGSEQSLCTTCSHGIKRKSSLRDIL